MVSSNNALMLILSCIVVIIIMTIGLLTNTYYYHAPQSSQVDVNFVTDSNRHESEEEWNWTTEDLLEKLEMMTNIRGRLPLPMCRPSKRMNRWMQEVEFIKRQSTVHRELAPVCDPRHSDL